MLPCLACIRAGVSRPQRAVRGGLCADHWRGRRSWGGLYDSDYRAQRQLVLKPGTQCATPGCTNLATETHHERPGDRRSRLVPSCRECNRPGRSGHLAIG